MADTTPWAAALAVLSPICLFLGAAYGSKRNSQANEKVGDRNAQALERNALLTAQTETKKAEISQNTETLKMFSEQLKEVQTNSKELEKNLRAELKALSEDNRRLQTDFNALDLRFAKLEIEHEKAKATVERLEHDNAGLKAEILEHKNEIAEQKAVTRTKDERIDILLGVQTGLMALLDARASDWRKDNKELIGTAEEQVKGHSPSMEKFGQKWAKEARRNDNDEDINC